MLSAMSKRESEAASAERIACFESITLLTIVRLMRRTSVSSGIPALDGLGHQPARPRIFQHDETAVGLEENLEEAIEQLGQDVVQVPTRGSDSG